MKSEVEVTVDIQGVVFDIDGTLLDNMAFHEEAFNTWAGKHGLPALTLETRKWMDGKRNRDIFPYLLKREMTVDEVDLLADEKESLYRTLSKGRLSALPGLERLLQLLQARGLPVALATSAPRANVEHTLAELKYTTRLPLVARSDEVPHGKPFPDVFLKAAELMGVDPTRCLAFEDAPAGIIAARAAGMTTIGVTTSYSPAILDATEPPPHAIVRDYDQFLLETGAWLTAASSDNVSAGMVGRTL
jgi:HAD superfamily hydrolase (TIGR01509 family)